VFLYNNKDHLSKNTREIKITDHGINVNDFNIPYEYLLTISRELNMLNENVIIISFLGKITEENESIKIELCNDITKILLFTDKNCKFNNMIVRNMFYHIKYNKINFEVIDYFKEN